MGDVVAGQGLGSLEITSRSGDVVVWGRPIARPEVLRGRAEVDVDGTVRSHGSDLVEIACPEGSDVVIGSSSGRVDCHGVLGRVAVTGRSGRISIDDARQVEIRTSSGNVAVGRCAESCRVAVDSGTVTIESAGSVDITVASGGVRVGATGGALVRGGSGPVELGLVGAGAVDVCTVSGSVSVSVPPECAPGLELVSRSGLVRSEVDPGRDGRLAVETSSGSITVSRG
jgi:DUF4097 and DUF4098 domain-containing protein YvlB